MATWFAANNGGGSGTSAATPATLSSLIGSGGSAVAGDTIRLLTTSGTFQGANNMIKPRSGLTNVTVVANDETDPFDIPLFDAQFNNEGNPSSDGRSGINLSNNAGWVIEGINVKNGYRSTVRIGESSHNVILRRVVAWDGHIGGNSNVMAVTTSNDVLFEDVAAFGTGRKTIGPTQSVNRFTCRRCFVRFEGSLSTGPIGASCVFNGFEYLWENLVANWSAKQMPSTYTVHDSWPPTSIGTVKTGGAIHGFKGAAGLERNDGTLTTNSRIRGSLAFVLAGDPLFTNAAWSHENQLQGGANNFSVVDAVGYISPQNSRYANADGFSHGGDYQNPFSGGSNLTGDRLTHVGGYFKGSQWVHTNVYNVSTSISTDAAALADLNTANRNPWTTTTGANLCYRYVNGVRQDGTGGTTATPLWPWPMDDRIVAATTIAGIYAGPCPTCSGGFTSARATSTVTATVEGLFGTIPAACRVSSPQIGLFPASLTYTMTVGDAPQVQTVTVSNIGADQPMPWSVSDNQTWLSESPTSAADEGTFNVTVDITGLVPGTYGGTITVTATPASNSPQIIPVTLTVESLEDTPTPESSPGWGKIKKIKRRFWGTFSGGW